jgi:hypothetical protein
MKSSEARDPPRIQHPLSTQRSRRFVMDGVNDFGFIVRTFFPIQSKSSRSSLCSFSSVATAVRNESPVWPQLSLTFLPNTLVLDLQISASTDLDALELGRFASDTRNFTTTCSLTLAGSTYNSSFSEWTVSICNDHRELATVTSPDRQ